MKHSKQLESRYNRTFVACIGFKSLYDFEKAIYLLKDTDYQVFNEDKKPHKHLIKVEKEVIEPLTKRETEVLELLSKGLSYSETAITMGCRLSTVQTYIKRIYSKFNSHSKTEAIYKGIMSGIICLPLSSKTHEPL